MTTSRILSCNPGLETMATACESADIWPPYPCAIGILNIELDNQLNRYFNFLVLLNFYLGSNGCPNNAIKIIII